MPFPISGSSNWPGFASRSRGPALPSRWPGTAGEFPPAVSLIESPTTPTAIAYEAIQQVYLQAASPEAAGRLGCVMPKGPP
jgi:hypothetical protein